MDVAAIEQFHQSGYRGVLAITGGGAQLIGELLCVPGGSASVLEAIVPYGEASLTDFLKRTPDQFCSADTALAMAAASLHRARQLTENATDQLIGLGVTAALASSRPKKGPHRAFIAVQTAAQTLLHSVTLAKNERTRVEEDAIVSAMALNALRSAIGLEVIEWPVPRLPNDQSRWDQAQAETTWQAVREHRLPYVIVGTQSATEDADRPTALLSGSFNPKHHGHARLRDAAAKFLNESVGFEIPIVNADKPPLDDITLRRRLSQFEDPVLLTAAPTFVDKARALPRTTFVIGVDTAVRVLDARFYHHGSVADALSTIRHQKCRFLVAARHDAGEVLALQDLAVPNDFEDLFIELPADQFLEDVSSTEIRSKGG